MNIRSPLEQERHRDKKTEWSLIIVLWLAGLFAAMQFAKFSVSYESLVNYYNASGELISVSLSIVGAIGIVFGTSAGILASKIGYKKILIASLVIGGFMSLLQSFLPSIKVVLMSRLFEGISHLGIVVASPTIMMSLCAKNHQSIVMGLWGTFFGVAFSITGWIGRSILHTWGLGFLYLLHAMLVVPIIVYLFLFLKNDGRIKPIEKHEPRHSIKSFVQSILDVYANPNTFFPSLVFLCHTCMFIALLTFVPRMAMSVEMQKNLLVILPLVSIFGTFMAGALCQYLLSPQLLATIAYIGVALSITLVVMFALTEELLLLWSVLLFICSGIVQGASFAMIPCMAKTPDQQAKSNGSLTQLGNLGATIGTPMFAVAISLFNMTGVLYLVLLLCGLGIIISIIAWCIHFDGKKDR